MAYPAESDAETFDHPMDEPPGFQLNRSDRPPPADDPGAVWKMVQRTLSAHQEMVRRNEEAWERRQEALQAKEEAWARRQADMMTAWRKEEEERAADRKAREERAEARRAAEWESFTRSQQPGPQKLPAPSTIKHPPEDEDDRGDSEVDHQDGGESEEEDIQEPQGPLDVPQPDAVPCTLPEDHNQYTDLMQRAAANFGVQMHKEQEPESFLLDKLSAPLRASNQLPIDKHIWKKGLEVLRKPASIPATNPRQEKKYRAPATDPLCLHGVPTPDSTVATAARKKAASSSLSGQTGPPEREHRRLDMVGKKVCATASLAIRQANANAMLARYDRDMWDEMEEYAKRLPEDCRQGALNTIAEGRLCANHGVKTALDLADAGFHSMAHGVALRRHGWLQGSGFKTDIQGRLLDMPFDGEQLFGKEVEESITKTKGELESTKVAELQQQQPKKKPFHQFPFPRQQNKPRRGKSWPPTRGYGNSRGQSRRGRGASQASRPAPKDKA